MWELREFVGRWACFRTNKSSIVYLNLNIFARFRRIWVFRDQIGPYSRITKILAELLSSTTNDDVLPRLSAFLR